MDKHELFTKINNQRLKLIEIDSDLDSLIRLGDIDKDESSVIYEVQAEIERIGWSLLELQRILA